MKSFYIPEPDLIFKDGNSCADPRVGLLNFYPNGLPYENLELPIGIIGSNKSINHAKEFFNILKYSIKGKLYPNSNIRSVDFPGLYKTGPLGFIFKIDENYCQEISEKSISKILNFKSRKDSIIEFSNEITQILKDLSGLNPPKPIILISIPEDILKKCADPFKKVKRINLSDRRYKTLKRITKLPEEDRPIFYDFHNYIKVIGYKLKHITQLILPETLNFRAGDEDDPASIAWNFCVAQYYKFLGVPWKLADLNPETIHVGISFYYDINRSDNVVIKAAIAQVYMRTGDSQVARGLELKAEHEKDIKRTNLTKVQAENILTKAINLYKRQHVNKKPYRIVVHKKCEYTEEEIEGFYKASEGIEVQDFLHIKERCSFKALTPTPYPIMSGSVFERKSLKKDCFNLYTIGYIPCLDTYPGSFVPDPIEVIIEKSDSDIRTLAKDIMDLSKLDWNSTEFCKRLPATIAVSRKVGYIMGELRGSDIEPPSAYCNYM